MADLPDTFHDAVARDTKLVRDVIDAALREWIARGEAASAVFSEAVNAKPHDQAKIDAAWGPLSASHENECRAHDEGLNCCLVSGSGTLTVTFTPPAGYVGTLHWIAFIETKGDQEARGEDVPLMHQSDKSVCPVALLTEYLTRVKPFMPIASQEHGPLFRRIDPRSDCVGDRFMWKDVMGDLVKAVCERAGLDPARFSSHSLRAGFITSAAGRGVSLENIMRQSRHKDARVAREYYRPKTAWDHNAAEGLADEHTPEAARVASGLPGANRNGKTGA